MSRGNRGGSPGTLTPSQSIYDSSATAKAGIGEKLSMGDGRVFYYGKAATTLHRGALVAPDTTDGGPFPAAVDGSCVAITAANRQLGDTTKAITAALAAGDNGIGVTHSSYLDGIVVHQLQNGYVFLNDTGNTQQYYKIKDNTAVAAVTADVIELLIYDEVRDATTDATCSVSLMQNAYMNLQLCDSTVDELCAGAAMVAATTASPYCWIQTWGECSVSSATDTAFAGTSITISTTAGDCEIHDSNGILPIIGHGISDVATAADGAPIYLMIRP